MQKIILILLISLCSSSCSYAVLKLPSVIDDNMILQQNKQNAIWGWANPGDKVNVVFMQKNYPTVTNKNGEWKILLNAGKANEGGNIEINCGNEKRIIKNVLFGEVWLCSGQSNMEFPMLVFKDVYSKEIETADDRNLRFIVIKNTFDNKEKENVEVKNKWTSVNSSTIENCSAVAYFFAKKLREKLNVPVGLIVSSWSGTPAQSWVDTTTLKEFPYYQKLYDDAIKPIDFSNLEVLKKKAADTYHQKITSAIEVFDKVKAIDYNDDDWEKMSLPKSWEPQGHPDLDGIAAYRISFTLSTGSENKTGVLHLPAIDDADSTYINGTFIGSQNIWNELRTYNVPANILKAGKNVITIWVEDDGGGGGMNADAENYFLQIADQKISLKGTAKFKILAPIETAAGDINFSSLQNQPAVLFNGMIAPLLPVNFAGVIWYQGESNADNYVEYRKLFPALINNWRKRFKQQLPFLFVQLASYNPDIIEPAESNWAGLREAQYQTLKLPKTGMAVTIDIGDQKDIHPKRKKEVGDRLAANAFNIVYGFRSQVAAGPVYRSFVVAGNNIKISYNNIGKGLEAKGNKLLGFSIAGADGKFTEADAVIKGDEVIVSTPAISSPMYVRYAWADAPMNANLYNKDGFPAAPFRTNK